jgi:hypothetical protein
VIEVGTTDVKVPAEFANDGFDDSKLTCLGCGAELPQMIIADRRHNIIECLFVLREKIIRLEAWKVDVKV